jgi:hypothetical protein
MSASEEPKHETGEGREEGEGRPRVGNLADRKHPVPLFLRDRKDARQGNAQDEKDETAE